MVEKYEIENALEMYRLAQKKFGFSKQELIQIISEYMQEQNRPFPFTEAEKMSIQTLIYLAGAFTGNNLTFDEDLKYIIFDKIREKIKAKKMENYDIYGELEYCDKNTPHAPHQFLGEYGEMYLCPGKGGIIRKRKRNDKLYIIRSIEESVDPRDPDHAYGVWFVQ